MPAALRCLCLLPLALLLGACQSLARSHGAVPQRWHTALQPAQRLVVVLPGRADDLAALERSGVVATLQRAWPDADVVLAELRLGDYRAGDALQRLHDSVVAPARQRGYRQLWFVGASLGGMGSVLYDRAFPGELDGIVLLAPYLGEKAQHAAIRAGGGLAAWDAGPLAGVDAATWQNELWRQVQRWAREPALGARVWLAYGDRDYLREAYPLLREAVPAEHVVVRPGAHAWAVWTPALAELLQRIGPDAPR